jgi:uncharacterized protein involved in exopolysaccharide biosynthesis
VSSHSPDPKPVRPLAKPTRSGRPDEADGHETSDAMESAPQPGIDQLREIIEDSIEVLRRRRRVFRGAFLGLAVLLSVAILMQTPLYESTSLMLVKFGRELVYQSEIGSERSFVSQNKAAVINSELAILRSQPVLEGTARAIGVGVLYPGLADAVEDTRAERADESTESTAETLLVAEAAQRLKLSVSTQALPEADVLQVSYQHPDPVVAANTVNELVARFLDAHLSAFAEPEVVQFLEGRLKSYDKRLTESEHALRVFQTEHPAFALENPQAALVRRRDEIRTSLTEVEGQMAAIRLRHLQEDASVAQARNQLLTLEVEASRLEGRLLRDTEGQIKVVKRFIAQRKAEIDQELIALDERHTMLLDNLKEVEAELAELPTLSAEYRRLERSRDGDEEQHATYSQRLHDARLSSDMDQEKIASINVIQPASPSPRPVWPPSKGMSIVFALVLSLVAATLFVILLDRIGPTGIALLDEQADEESTG